MSRGANFLPKSKSVSKAFYMVERQILSRNETLDVF